MTQMKNHQKHYTDLGYLQNLTVPNDPLFSKL